MKKTLLLGTTALVAAGFAVSSVAQAEEPISAGISGYYKAALGLINQDDADGEAADNNDSIALGQDLEISIGGSTTLDNGLTAGFNAQIEGSTAAPPLTKNIFLLVAVLVRLLLVPLKVRGKQWLFSHQTETEQPV